YELKNLQISNNKIFLEIENFSDGLLVISQNFYPGWKCYVNGCSEKIYHCNIFMMCIPLRSGKNEVFLKFEPLSFKIGTILSLISILMCFLYLFEKGG
ncbi:MAG: YfhO family protein, partial [Candidatus Anstonellales archaeon]